MKNRLFLIFVILFGVLSTIFVSSCSKDKEDENNNISKNHFSVTIDYGTIYDYYWVILYNLEGTEVIDYKKITGAGTADFGEINEDLITTTIVKVDTTTFKDTQTWIEINSNYSLPCGDLKFIYDYCDESFGTADLTMTYASGNYNSYLFSSTATGGGNISSFVPGNEINKQLTVCRLQDDNKVSFYCAVYAEKGGLCNWLMNQDFQLNSTNNYSFELNKFMDTKTVITDKALKYFQLYAYLTERNSYFTLCHNMNNEQQTNHLIQYPFDIPVSELKFTGNGYNEDGYFYYAKFFGASLGLPDNINLPATTVTATYDETNDEIINIQINGTADQVAGHWAYNSSYGGEPFNIFWTVYANNDITSIKRPVLPQEVKDDIGDELDLAGINSVSIIDYNTTLSQADITNRFFINNVPHNQRYDECFIKYYYLNKNKSQNFEFNDLDDRLMMSIEKGL